MDFEAERNEAQRLLSAFGPHAVHQASNNADSERLKQDFDKAAHWQRVTAFIMASSPTAIDSVPCAIAHRPVFRP